MSLRKEDVFQATVTHMLDHQQGLRSTDGNQRCMYRGNFNRSCPAGCWIPDEQYDPRIENFDFLELVRMRICPEVFQAELTDHIGMLGDLTYIHDEVHRSLWEERIAQVAFRHGIIWDNS